MIIISLKKKMQRRISLKLKKEILQIYSFVNIRSYSSEFYFASIAHGVRCDKESGGRVQIPFDLKKDVSCVSSL